MKQRILMIGLCLMFLVMVGCAATMTETKTFDAMGKVTTSTLSLKDYAVTESKTGVKTYVPKPSITTDFLNVLIKSAMPAVGGL
jgi:hypothetical protein